MILKEINILNYKNIADANLTFSEKVNCFVGLNGQGKTNLLDAIYLLSFTKSAFTTQDSACIRHGEQMAMVKGSYSEDVLVSCGLKVGVKKQFRVGQKDYKRLLDHIGRIPCVMVCPQDQELLTEGSDERRRFMDSVISQQDRTYLEHLTHYNALLKQRNTVLKQLADRADYLTAERSNSEAAYAPSAAGGLLEVYEMQMLAPALYIYEARTRFIEAFVPVFQDIYAEISGGNEEVSLTYISQLQDRNLSEAWVRTRQRDLILGWTSQGIHKDDILMQIQLSGSSPEEKLGSVKQFGSQGQQKTYVLAMKLAQALYLSQKSEVESQKPILLLDDIFDKLDSERVERIVRLVSSDRFGQIFITDTDRQHLTDILHPDEQAKIFYVENGNIIS